jgi:hypothetical protein
MAFYLYYIINCKLTTQLHHRATVLMWMNYQSHVFSYKTVKIISNSLDCLVILNKTLSATNKNIF